MKKVRRHPSFAYEDDEFEQLVKQKQLEVYITNWSKNTFRFLARYEKKYTNVKEDTPISLIIVTA